MKEYDWREDKVSFRFVNLKAKEDHMTSVNGELFFIKNNKINTTPRAVYSALNDAVELTYPNDVKEINEDVKPVPDPRFFVQIVDESTRKEELTGKEKNLETVMVELTA